MDTKEKIASILNIENIEDYKLCYVNNNTAYFTPKSLDEQWGDDWDDIPYEHNADEPYDHIIISVRQTESGIRVANEIEHYEIIKLSFDGNSWYEPCYNYTNSPYSVKKINNGEIAWLRHYDDYKPIMAGDSIFNFIEKMTAAGSEVFIPFSKIKQ